MAAKKRKVLQFLELKATDETKKAMRTAQASVVLMQKRVKSLKAAYSLLDRRMAKVHKRLKAGARAFKSAGAKMSAAFTAPLAAIAAVGVRSVATYQRNMNAAASLSGATRDEFESLTATVQGLGATTPFSLSQISKSAQGLALAGQDVSEIINTLPGVLSLATVGETELAQASKLLSGSLAALDLPAGKATMLVDKFSRALAGAKMEFEEFKVTSSYVTSISKEMGVSIDELLALVMGLHSAGIEGSAAGTAIRKMFSEFAAAAGGGAKQKALESLVGPIIDSEGEFIGAVRIFERMAAVMESRGTKGFQKVAAVGDIFGKMAGPKLVSFLRFAQSGQLREYEKMVKDSKGFGEKQAEAFINGMAGGFPKALAEIDSQFQAILNKFVGSDAGVRLFERVTGIIKDLNTSILNIKPEKVDQIVDAFVFLAKIGPSLIAVGVAIQGVSLAIKAVQGVVAGFQVAKGLGMLPAILGMGKVGLIIAAIALVAGAIYLIYKNWDKIMAFIRPGMEWLEVQFGRLRDLLDSLKRGFQSLIFGKKFNLGVGANKKHEILAREKHEISLQRRVERERRKNAPELQSVGQTNIVIKSQVPVQGEVEKGGAGVSLENKFTNNANLWDYGTFTGEQALASP